MTPDNRITIFFTESAKGGFTDAELKHRVTEWRKQGLIKQDRALGAQSRVHETALTISDILDIKITKARYFGLVPETASIFPKGQEKNILTQAKQSSIGIVVTGRINNSGVWSGKLHDASVQNELLQQTFKQMSKRLIAEKLGISANEISNIYQHGLSPEY